MFTADFKEKSMNKIVLKDTPVEPFLAMLRYVYYGQLTLSDYPEDQVLETYRLADYYEVEDLTESIVTYFASTLNMDNVRDRLEAAMKLGLQELESQCLDYIDRHALRFFVHASFLGLQQVR
jgi:hypothetical protein